MSCVLLYIAKHIRTYYIYIFKILYIHLLSPHMIVFLYLLEWEKSFSFFLFFFRILKIRLLSKKTRYMYISLEISLSICDIDFKYSSTIQTSYAYICILRYNAYSYTNFLSFSLFIPLYPYMIVSLPSSPMISLSEVQKQG